MAVDGRIAGDQQPGALGLDAPAALIVEEAGPLAGEEGSGAVAVVGDEQKAGAVRERNALLGRPRVYSLRERHDAAEGVSVNPVQAGRRGRIEGEARAGAGQAG